jgi:hypothetical protein
MAADGMIADAMDISVPGIGWLIGGFDFIYNNLKKRI